MPLSRPPFCGLNARQWLNLIWFALFVFYISFGAYYVVVGGVCDYFGNDFRAFFASAQITYQRGIAQVYNRETQTEYQVHLYNQCPSDGRRLPFLTVPMPYLPAFVLLFMPLIPFDFVPAFFIWATLNLLALVLYMLRFKKALGLNGGRDILFQLVVCLPVFSNLFLGQVNVWLLICLGEFFLAGMQGKSFRSGLWLAGMLLKPQTLILIVPGLLLSRRFKELGGFAVGSLVVGLLSVALAGGYALGDLVLLIIDYMRGIPTNVPEVMMNWRALATNLSGFQPSPLAWGVAVVGMVATTVGGLYFWTRPIHFSSPHFGLALLGTYAATCAVTWHAHIHMVLPVIPLLLFLYAKGQLSWEPLYLWLFAAPVVFLGALVIRSDLAYNLFGLSTFALNLYLLVWALRRFKRTCDPAPIGDDRSRPGLG